MYTENNMSTIRNKDTFFPSRKVFGYAIVIELTKKGIQIYDHAVSDNVDAFVAYDARRKNMEVVAFTICNYRMSGIISTLASSSYVHLIIIDQIVDELSLSFVTPLQPN
jgi:hypothetical protein